MKILHSWLQNYFDKPIPSAEKLAELFTFHSFEVEGIEKHGDQEVLDVKILPDRAHSSLSHHGIAREVSVLTGISFKKDRLPPGPKDTLSKKVDVRIEAPNFCRRYMARYGEIGSVAPSNPHAHAMLGAIGQRSINAVVDATNIVMFDMGQPLHIFDADKIVGSIVIRAAKKGEQITLLDSSAGEGRTVDLLETDHVIADDDGPIAIAGVKGGKRSGVTDKTRHIVVESANFDPACVRRTATRLNLRSEASKRYENEITPAFTVPAMDNVCSLVQYNIKDAVFGPVVDIYPAPVSQRVVVFDPATIENRLGVKIPENTSIEILNALQMSVSKNGSVWNITVPFERLDIQGQEDIVEEIGRVYGYDKIIGILPTKTASEVKVLPEYYLIESIRNILTSKGFSEAYLYSLVSKGVIEVAYPLAKDKACVRENLSDGMMICLEKNIMNADLLGEHTVKMFEIGHTFTKNGEQLVLSLGVAQAKKVKGVTGQSIIEETIKNLQIVLGCDFPNTKPVIKGLCAVVDINLTEVLNAYKLPANATYTDLYLGKASSARYTKFSAYPFVVRDIALFVPAEINPENVWDSIEGSIKESGALELLVKHYLFDTFSKDGRTSYAFRMVFQALDRTLTDVETNKVMDAVYVRMKEKGWEVR